MPVLTITRQVFSASESLVVRQGLMYENHTQDFVPTELATSSLCGTVLRKLGWRLFSSVTPGVSWSWPSLGLYSQVSWGCGTADVFREVTVVRATWSSQPDLADHFLNSPVEGAVSSSLSVHRSFVLKTSQGVFKALRTVWKQGIMKPSRAAHRNLKEADGLQVWG